ncbi:hypothetical protein C8Q72DRAFT_900501 [Fomitopsis betulina]|nr:hypothetical protein C8Q72DRAFT_900501 [Fomitopsis betulina]
MIRRNVILGTASSDDWLPHVGRVAVITRTTSDDKTSPSNNGAVNPLQTTVPNSWIGVATTLEEFSRRCAHLNLSSPTTPPPTPPRPGRNTRDLLPPEPPPNSRCAHLTLPPPAPPLSHALIPMRHKAPSHRQGIVRSAPRLPLEVMKIVIDFVAEQQEDSHMRQHITSIGLDVQREAATEECFRRTLSSCVKVFIGEWAVCPWICLLKHICLSSWISVTNIRHYFETHVGVGYLVRHSTVDVDLKHFTLFNIAWNLRMIPSICIRFLSAYRNVIYLDVINVRHATFQDGTVVHPLSHLVHCGQLRELILSDCADEIICHVFRNIAAKPLDVNNRACEPFLDAMADEVHPLPMSARSALFIAMRAEALAHGQSFGSVDWLSRVTIVYLVHNSLDGYKIESSTPLIPVLLRTITSKKLSTLHFSVRFGFSTLTLPTHKTESELPNSLDSMMATPRIFDRKARRARGVCDTITVPSSTRECAAELRRIEATGAVAYAIFSIPRSFAISAESGSFRTGSAQSLNRSATHTHKRYTLSSVSRPLVHVHSSTEAPLPVFTAQPPHQLLCAMVPFRPRGGQHDTAGSPTTAACFCTSTRERTQFFQRHSITRDSQPHARRGAQAVEWTG